MATRVRVKCVTVKMNFQAPFPGIPHNNSAHERFHSVVCWFHIPKLHPRERESDKRISPIVSIFYYILSHENIFNFFFPPTYKHRKLVHLQIFSRPNSYKKKETRRGINTRDALLSQGLRVLSNFCFSSIVNSMETHLQDQYVVLDINPI